LNITYNQKMFY